LICRIETEGTSELPAVGAWVDAARAGEWGGLANALSGKHQHDWLVIEEVHEASLKPPTVSANWRPPPTGPLLGMVCEQSAAALIKQRRSAQAFDGVTAIPAKTLFRLLEATLPREDASPFDLWLWPPRVHLLLFVHRVEGLSPGLYLFCRRDGVHGEFREAFRADFAWDVVAGCPEHFALYQLVRANAQKVAKTLSCHQDIAADGALSLGMLAEFDAALAEGPWVYRRLFWECGLIGQALYLEAEAAGVRGTGIGCFFDDPVHELLGLAGTRFQSLYHFTVGGALVDERLKTLPAYGHLGQGS
jgi:nitroreductase